VANSVCISDRSDIAKINASWAANGIYQIEFEAGGFYIGSACDILKRIRRHFFTLSNGEHRNAKMQREWDRQRAFYVRPLLFCRDVDSIFYEQLLLDRFNPPLNLRMVATRRIWTKETRNKISLALKGRVFSEETRKKISINRTGLGIGNKNRLGKKNSPEEVERQRQYALGRKPSAENLAKRSQSLKRVWAEKRAMGKINGST